MGSPLLPSVWRTNRIRRKGSDPTPLSEPLTACWNRFQDRLCPSPADTPGPLNQDHKRLIAVLDLAPPESLVRGNALLSPGRPQHSRTALARSFIAKAVYNLPTTRSRIDRVEGDPVLRRLCGRETVWTIPGESTCSGAFAEQGVPSRLHGALIETAWIPVSATSGAMPRPSRDGYRLHVDAADGAVPVSCILTSASLHDCQVGQRVTCPYELMDAAYDSKDIAGHSRASGHVPIIAV